MSRNELYYTNTGFTSQSPPSYSVHQHACITLNWADRLRLIRFPSAIIDVVRQAILVSWHRGLQNEKLYAGAYEFKLSGNPWVGQGVKAVESRTMMMSVLSALHHHGWNLLKSTDVFKKEQDKDTLIFQFGIPLTATSFFAVSFNELDKLRLIDVPPELISAVQQTIGTSEIQLLFIYRCGYPWAGNSDESVTSRIKILALLDCFTAFGWQLHASIDMSTGHEGCDTDTWFLCRSNQ